MHESLKRIMLTHRNLQYTLKSEICQPGKPGQQKSTCLWIGMPIPQTKLQHRYDTIRYDAILY